MQRERAATGSSAAVPVQEKPVLLEAINLTLQTIECRARLYRNLLVAVSVVSVVSILTAVLCWRGWPVAGLILAVPLAGGFLLHDTRRVRRWFEEILQMRRERGLDAALFLETIGRFKHVPSRSLQGMLLMLAPDEGSGQDPKRQTAGRESWPGSPLRAAEWRIMATTTALTLALGCLVFAVGARRLWLLIPAGGLAILCGFLRRKSRRSRPRSIGR